MSEPEISDPRRARSCYGRAVAAVAGASVAARVVIGFRRESFGRLPRVTPSAVATTAFLIAASTTVALLSTSATDPPFATSLLVAAPAGVTEMVLTTSDMRFDAATVVAFQIVRVAVVATTILPALRAFETPARRIEGPRV